MHIFLLAAMNFYEFQISFSRDETWGVFLHEDFNFSVDIIWRYRSLFCDCPSASVPCEELSHFLNQPFMSSFSFPFPFFFFFFLKPMCYSASVDALLFLQTETLLGFAVRLALFWKHRKILIQSSKKETVVRLLFRGVGKPVHFYAGKYREQIHNSVQEQMNSQW